MKREDGWTRTFCKCSLTSFSTSMRISSSRTPRRGATGGPSEMTAEHLRIVLDNPSCTNLLARQQHEQFPSTCGGLCVSCHLPLPDLLQTDFQNSPKRPFYESGDKLHDQRPHFENLPKLTNPVAMDRRSGRNVMSWTDSLRSTSSSSAACSDGLKPHNLPAGFHSPKPTSGKHARGSVVAGPPTSATESVSLPAIVLSNAFNNSC